MILGDVCTRNCRFCAVPSGNPIQLETDEADRIVRAVRELGLKYAVITSVTRDDLPDGGAYVFAEVIRSLRSSVPGIRIEVLVPDFQGRMESIRDVIDAGPDVFNHNIETVPRLYPLARPMADYQRSLDVLSVSARLLGPERTKSGIMAGLGESAEELLAVLSDLRNAGTGRITIGQYLQPSKDHLPVERFIPPEEFRMYEVKARELGFTHVASGPLVRSSYQAHKMH